MIGKDASPVPDVESALQPVDCTVVVPLAHCHAVTGMRTQLSGLPDAERRAAAADMALKLASLMGLGDEEGSSEEEDVAQQDVQRL